MHFRSVPSKHNHHRRRFVPQRPFPVGQFGKFGDHDPVQCVSPWGPLLEAPPPPPPLLLSSKASQVKEVDALI